MKVCFMSVNILLVIVLSAIADSVPGTDITGDGSFSVNDSGSYSKVRLAENGGHSKVDLFPESGDAVIGNRDLTHRGQRRLGSLKCPYPKEELSKTYQEAAKYILSQTGFTNRGYCFVYGSGEGRLAWHLAVRSEFNIIGVDSDSAKIDAGRTRLHSVGVYGDRITLHKGSLDKLRYRDYAAALVVCDSIIEKGVCPGNASELFRMVRPDGGVAIIGQPSGCPNVLERHDLEAWLDAGGLTYLITEDENGLWAKIIRGPLKGAGTWTHLWANPSNSACSDDQRISDQYDVLWYGEPGPRVITDRHWRPMAPLINAGKLIVPGDNQIICADAYNGARLWQRDFPASSRIAILRDAGWVAMDDESLFVVAGDTCHKLNLDTGRVVAEWNPPATQKDWGYLAVEGDLLFGSQQAPGASRLSKDYYDKGIGGNQISRKDNQPTVVSTDLFCKDKSTGKLRWNYCNNSVIANPTICVGDAAVYFIESYAPIAVNDGDARVCPTDFCRGDNEYIVKLNKETGQFIWRKQYDLPFANIIYLSYANNIVLASGCYNQDHRYWYHYRAVNANDGSTAWHRDWDSGFAASDLDHGKQDKHPMIAGDTVYLKYGSFNLQTGLPTAHGSNGLTFGTTNCADCSSSGTHIFARNGGNPTAYNMTSGLSSKLSSAMRPGCYISIIPAGGIVVLPAYSAGCTCGYTLQTSIGWLPR
jgi:hypothetical protein